MVEDNALGSRFGSVGFGGGAEGALHSSRWYGLSAGHCVTKKASLGNHWDMANSSVPPVSLD